MHPSVCRPRYGLTDVLFVGCVLCNRTDVVVVWARMVASPFPALAAAAVLESVQLWGMVVRDL